MEKNPVQSAERIFLLLETLAEYGPAGVTELSTMLGLHKSTVHRLLTSLISMNYVKKEESSGKYTLTFKLVGMAGKLLSKIDILSIAHPIMEKLANLSNETVHLVQREDNRIVYIDKVESETNSIRMVSRIGLSHPIIQTAVGKAMLSRLPLDEVHRIWETSEIIRRTEHTIVDYDQLLEELKEIRTNGYALDNEENEIGVRCIGAYILDFQGKVNNAFSISAPASRMDDNRIKELSQYVLNTRQELSYALGYRGKF